MFQRAAFHVLEVMFADRSWKQIKVKPEDDGFLVSNNTMWQFEHAQELNPGAVYASHCRIDDAGKVIDGSMSSISYRNFRGF